MRVYFDNAATTPISQEVIDVMMPCMQEHYGNPSSIHGHGRKARAIIEEARKSVAEHIGASIGEIFFTSCGTESNNMALKCAVRDLGVQRIISSATEHHCISHTLESLEKNANVKIVLVNVNEKGQVDLAHLEELLQQDDYKTLVSLMHANNEIGTILDIENVGHMCRSYNTYFHSDSVQTMGHLKIDVSTFPINFLVASAHKFHGPKGCGFIYINNDSQLRPFIDGGSQERNMRGGTENIYGIVGLAKAFELACNNMDTRREHILGIRQYMKEQLTENFEDIQYNGDYEGDSLYTVLSVSFPPSSKSDMLLLSLDIAGISASGGSACISGAEAGSHVLSAIHVDPKRKTIRFSFSHYNTKEEVDYVIEKLKSIIPKRLAELPKS